MKLSLKIIGRSAFPIQVTSAYYKGELASWEKSFIEQGVKIAWKLERTENRKDRKTPAEYYSLWRQVTPRELKEIKRNEWVIRENSFIKPERYKHI